jgi:hypothetical protein
MCWECSSRAREQERVQELVRASKVLKGEESNCCGIRGIHGLWSYWQSVFGCQWWWWWANWGWKVASPNSVQNFPKGVPFLIWAHILRALGDSRISTTDSTVSIHSEANSRRLSPDSRLDAQSQSTWSSLTNSIDYESLPGMKVHLLCQSSRLSSQRSISQGTFHNQKDPKRCISLSDRT